MAKKLYLWTGRRLDRPKFYALQRVENFASTTQIAPWTFLSWFEPVLEAGQNLMQQNLMYFSCTLGLCGTCVSAQVCMEELRAKYSGRTIVCVEVLAYTVEKDALLRKHFARQRKSSLLRKKQRRNLHFDILDMSA